MEAKPARPGFFERLAGRWRNGLLVQELLDRLRVLGIVVQPYVVTREGFAELPAVAPPPGYAVRELGPDDVPAMVAINIHRRDPAQLRAQFASRRCFGVFHGEQLVGHSWVDLDAVLALREDALFALGPDEAYYTDMFIAPAHRGARLAPWLRASLMHAMAAEGRTQGYSVSLVFNRSTRRFKARLGAREVEWRTRLQLLPRLLPGIDLRLRRRDATLRTPRLLVVGHPRRKERPGPHA